MGCSESYSDNFSKEVIKKDSMKFQFQIYAAFKLNNFALIKDLLEKSFDIHYKMPAFLGKTVLHLAAEFCDNSTIAYLIEQGADPNALDYSGCPPVFVAMKFGRLENVKAICKLGENVNLNYVTSHGLCFHDFIHKSKYRESVSLMKAMNYPKLGMISKRNKVD